MYGVHTHYPVECLILSTIFNIVLKRLMKKYDFSFLLVVSCSHMPNMYRCKLLGFLEEEKLQGHHVLASLLSCIPKHNLAVKVARIQI